MGQREGLRLLTMAALLTTGFPLTNNYFKELRGYIVEGHIHLKLQSASLSRCFSVCLTQRPTCRAFNVRNIGDHNRNYTCEVLTSYYHLAIDDRSALYYDRDMYWEFGFKVDLGRLVHYQPAPSSGLSWWGAQQACKDLWGEFLVPRTQEEWEWMKDVYGRMSYHQMWLPILEINEEDVPYRHYVWAGWRLNSTGAPGNVDITWIHDQVTIRCTQEEGYSCDTEDCGLLRPSQTTPPLEVIIAQCHDYVVNVGYICEAAIPDPATHTWSHP
ncbi:uncharacterized protein [Panulirus ornatus]|uniref:uncharacterized protein n=1 Tax=Panulirus ornatus TaxID=150431 RepID=UPI003A8913F3